MINTYRLNPHEYLTVTACRRNLAGDVCAIIRVHAVLEQWGLINYQVDPDTRPSAIGPPFTGHFRVTADTPRGLTPLLPAIQKEPKMNININIKDSPAQLKKLPMVFSSDVYKKRSQDEDMVKRKKQKLSCQSCGSDILKQRYHCTKDANVDICKTCYQDGRFPSAFLSGDFIKLESKEFDDYAEWTPQETLLLLEAIELFDDDWLKIQEHVKTKTRDQCVLHFLKVFIDLM
jgi:SWI/SNF related-matrix-associated actin-dependent regulator of chromatin subfamily C